MARAERRRVLYTKWMGDGEACQLRRGEATSSIFRAIRVPFAVPGRVVRKYLRNQHRGSARMKIIAFCESLALCIVKSKKTCREGNIALERGRH